MALLADAWAAIAIRLAVATLIGLALGLERGWRGHDAGLRTHALVSLSAATITVSALLIAQEQTVHMRPGDPLRVVEGLTQAIGFIAGGLIFVRGGDVRNMTTAATLWLAAAMGITAGAGQIALLAIAAAITALLMTVVTALERALTRRRKPDGSAKSHMPNRRGMIDRDA